MLSIYLYVLAPSVRLIRSTRASLDLEGKGRSMQVRMFCDAQFSLAFLYTTK